MTQEKEQPGTQTVDPDRLYPVPRPMPPQPLHRPKRPPGAEPLTAPTPPDQQVPDDNKKDKR